MLDPHRGTIDGWLDAEPAITAVKVLARLRTRHPDRLADIHLRTVQRAVKVWREEQAKRVLRCGTEALKAMTATAAIVPGPLPWAYGDGPGTEELGSIRR